MSETYPAQSPAEQLDNLATQAEASGLHINAETFAQLAREFRQLQADLDCAHRRISEQSRALDRARAATNEAVAKLQAVA